MIAIAKVVAPKDFKITLQLEIPYEDAARLQAWLTTCLKNDYLYQAKQLRDIFEQLQGKIDASFSAQTLD